MTTATDIDRAALLDIMRAEQSRADRISLVLLRTLEAHRQIQPTAETIERGNTAELQELAEMRQALDDADYAPTLTGLREALSEAERAVRVWKEQDEALRAERDTLRAEVAALTPGPWLDPPRTRRRSGSRS
jgi:hypothetical protein